LLVAALVITAVWAWYISSRELAAETATERWWVVRLAAVVSAGVGFVILALGVVGLVVTDDWVILVPTWSLGLLHLGVVTWLFRRARRSIGKAGTDR